MYVFFWFINVNYVFFGLLKVNGGVRIFNGGVLLKVNGGVRILLVYLRSTEVYVFFGLLKVNGGVRIKFT